MTDNIKDYTVRPGLPFRKQIQIVGGTLVWPTLAGFEIRAQLRKFRGSDSQIICNLHDFMTPSIVGADIIIDWILSGSQTAANFTSAGYYDVIGSEPGTADTTGVWLFGGKITLGDLTTKPSGTT